MTEVAPDSALWPDGLRIEHEIDDQGVVLALTGELDFASCPALDRKLRGIDGTNPTRLVIDLRQLDFMDSSGLSLIICAQRSAHADGYPFALRRGPTQIQRLFETAGVLDLLKFED